MTPDRKSRKPQARTALTRARILQAARDLAGQRSLDTLTAEAVASEAGVAKGTIFAHFGDMDGLLSYLLLDRLKDLRTATNETDQTVGDDLRDPVGAVVRRMMALVSVISDSQTMLRVFMENIGVTKGHCAPEFVAELDALDASLSGVLNRWREAPDISPALRADRDTAELLDGLIAFMIHGAILYQSHQIADFGEIKARLRRHVEAFLLA